MQKGTAFLAFTMMVGVAFLVLVLSCVVAKEYGPLFNGLAFALVPIPIIIRSWGSEEDGSRLIWQSFSTCFAGVLGTLCLAIPAVFLRLSDITTLHFGVIMASNVLIAGAVVVLLKSEAKEDY
eukprot:TRINITY_DN776623_c0_g1_i1.p1 TRINITY_DN776623_c0_g1~~TRINITY_DN776623_c0_g1_i1.p1  ORF type:complete len:123 (+),score=44.61 TRINITY_DN776623_c0_g1_i1:62-430(+)